MEHQPAGSTGFATSLRPFTFSKTIGLAVFDALLATANPRGEGLPIRNPRELLALDPAAFAELLETARPPAVSAQARMIVVASLPAEGEIVALDASSRQKLAALSPVLRAVRREGVYDITVVDVPQAAIGIHGRAVVLISGTALNLLDAKELAAAVAHEAAHEYLWGEWERSVRHGDRHRLKEIELICDSISPSGVATPCRFRIGSWRVQAHHEPFRIVEFAPGRGERASRLDRRSMTMFRWTNGLSRIQDAGTSRRGGCAGDSHEPRRHIQNGIAAGVTEHIREFGGVLRPTRRPGRTSVAGSKQADIHNVVERFPRIDQVTIGAGRAWNGAARDPRDSEIRGPVEATPFEHKPTRSGLVIPQLSSRSESSCQLLP